MLYKVEICALFLLLTMFGIGQSSFEYSFGTPEKEWTYTAFEHNGYYYVLSNRLYPGNYMYAVISKCSNGNDLFTKEFSKADSSVVYLFGSGKDDGNILLFGGVDNGEDSLINYTNIMYVCEMTDDLEIVSEKYYDLLTPDFDYLTLYDLEVNQDGHYILAGHMDKYGPSTYPSLLMVELDSDGNLINYNNLESIWYSGTLFGELVVKQDGSGYYYLNGGSYQLIKLNLNFEVVGSVNFLDLGHATSVKYLTDENLAAVSMRSNNQYYYDLTLQKFNSNISSLKDTVIVEEGRQCPALIKGIDFTDPNHIWVVAHNDWNAPTGYETYKIYIFDSELNVVGSKYYGGDTGYDFYYLLATQDGGCLIVGNVKQEQGSLFGDIFIKKVMPDDILTGNDENMNAEFKDILVYPNPFSNFIYFKTDLPFLEFTMYNLNGEIVFSCPVCNQNDKISIEIKAGIYMYSITNKEGKTYSVGKLIKK